jgi:protein phosphatase
MALAVEVAGKTDVGTVRANNEDNFGYDARYGIFVVCDGMGGQAAGEVASKIGVDTVLGYFRDAARSNVFPQEGKPPQRASTLGKALASALHRANRAVFQAGKKQESRAGMGTTMVAAVVRGKSLNIANVGDSRIYLFRNGTIEQLTEDHSLVMEQVRRGYLSLEDAERSEMQNIILRALGSEDDVVPDIESLITLPGDYLLLATDGLTRRVRDAEILRIVAAAPSLEKACDTLVQAAKNNRGDDNITCLLLRVVDRPWYKSIWKKLFPGGREWQNSI